MASPSSGVADLFSHTPTGTAGAGTPSGVGDLFGPAPAPPAPTVVPPPPPPAHSGGGGGILGAIEKYSGADAVSHAVGQAAHYTAKTGTGLATDLYNTPGGIYTLLKATAAPGTHPSWGTLEKAYLAGQLPVEAYDVVTGHPGRILAPLSGKNTAADPLAQVMTSMGKQTLQSITDPAYIRAHPDQTLLTLLALTGAAGKAADIGTATKAGLTGGEVAPATRTLDLGAGGRTEGGLQTVHPLASTNPVVRRLVQGPLDVITQHGLNNPEGKLGSFASRRAGRVIEENTQRVVRQRTVPAKRVEAQGAKLGGRARGAITGSRKVQQAALRLTAEQALPDDRIATHEAAVEQMAQHAAALAAAPDEQTARIHEAALTKLGKASDHVKQIKLLQDVKNRGLVTTDEGGHVVISPEHKLLAAVDARLANLGHLNAAEVDRIDYQNAHAPYVDPAGHIVQPTPEEVATKLQQLRDSRQARIDAPNQIHAGAEYVRPTPGRLGVPSDTLIAARNYEERLQALHDRAAAKATAAGEEVAGRQASAHPPGEGPVLVGHRLVGPGMPQSSRAGAEVVRTEERTVTVPRTREDAQAHLAKLEKDREQALDTVAEGLLGPYDKVAGMERGRLNAKARRQEGGITKSGARSGSAGFKYRVKPSLKQERRNIAEQAIYKQIEGDPAHPVSQAWLVRDNEIERLQKVIHPEPDFMRDEVPPEFDVHEGGQTRIGAAGDQTNLVPLAAGEVPASEAGNLAASSLEETAAAARAAKAAGPEFGTKEVTKTVKVMTKGRGKIPGPGQVSTVPGAARSERLGSALSVAKERRQSLEAAAARRQKQVGIVGGKGARPGRQYVGYYRTEPNTSAANVTRNPGPIVGRPQEAITKHPFTGASIQQGLVPDNTTGLAARHFARIVKEAVTTELRSDIPGSPRRLSQRDVLVNTQELKNARVPEDLKTAVGQNRSTLDELKGEHDAWEAFKQDIVPGLSPAREHDGLPHDAPNGTAAPAGYKWVDKNVLGSLGKPAPPLPTKLARGIDAANAAQTAATVYYKLGHVATRAGTDAFAALVQGSLHPAAMTKAFRTWHALTEGERDQALASVGGGGFSALPQEGLGKIGRAARFGSSFWAHRVDAPFRFLSLHYEANRSGFGSVDKFKAFLQEAKDLRHLNPGERATVEGVLARADRAAIRYDGLNDFEKRYANRAIWFYPWYKGASKFVGHALVEHPVKSAAALTLARGAAQNASNVLGPQPSYNAGLFPVGGSAAFPTVVNANTLTPAATPAQALESLVHLNRPTQAEQLSSYLSPALRVAGDFAYHLSPYGSASKTGTLKGVASDILSAVPESGILQAFRQNPAQRGRKMFPATGMEALLRFLIGSEYPRKENVQVANRSAINEQLAQRGRK